MVLHPGQAVFGSPDRQPGKTLVGLSAGDLQKVFEIFLLRIVIDQRPERAGMHAAEVAGVPGVATAIGLWRGLKDDDGRALFRSGDGGAQRGVAAADNRYVIRSCHCGHPPAGKVRHQQLI